MTGHYPNMEKEVLIKARSLTVHIVNITSLARHKNDASVYTVCLFPKHFMVRMTIPVLKELKRG